MLAILAMTSDFYDRKSEATSHFYDRKSEATSHLSLESCQTQLQSPDSPGSANSEDQQSNLDLSGGSTSQHQDSLWPVQDRAGDQGAPPLLQMPALWIQPEGVQGSSPVRDLCRTSQQRCLPEEAKQIIQHSSPQVHQLCRGSPITFQDVPERLHRLPRQPAAPSSEAKHAQPAVTAPQPRKTAPTQVAPTAVSPQPVVVTASRMPIPNVWLQGGKSPPTFSEVVARTSPGANHPDNQETRTLRNSSESLLHLTAAVPEPIQTSDATPQITIQSPGT